MTTNARTQQLMNRGIRERFSSRRFTSGVGRLIRLSIALTMVLGVLLSGSPAAAEAANQAADSAQATEANAPQSVNPAEVGVDEKLGQTAALDLTLRDESGNPVSLRSLVDRPTILTLNYFRCGGICSPQLNGLAKALSRTNAIPGKEFRVITVSFDDRDTAEIAAHKQTSYLREVKRQMEPADWRFLTGDAASTRRLADSVGFKFKRVGSDFVHAGALMLLSPKGVVTRYMYGTSFLPADLELAVREAANGSVQPTINKWLKFCFSYDPAGRRYMLDTTRIAGTLVIGAAMAFAFVLLRKSKHSKLDATEKES